jgi:hypothetical protein
MQAGHVPETVVARYPTQELDRRKDDSFTTRSLGQDLGTGYVHQERTKFRILRNDRHQQVHVTECHWIHLVRHQVSQTMLTCTIVRLICRRVFYKKLAMV